MPGRPATTGVSRSVAPPGSAPRWPFAFLAAAGVLGAAGVGVGAAGAHVGAGDLARLSSEFLLIHAAALAGGSGVALSARRRSVLLVAALGLLAAGAALFGGELAFAALLDLRPLPLAAPVGGLLLVAGWLCLAAAAVALGFGQARA